MFNIDDDDTGLYDPGDFLPEDPPTHMFDQLTTDELTRDGAAAVNTGDLKLAAQLAAVLRHRHMATTHA